MTIRLAAIAATLVWVPVSRRNVPVLGGFSAMDAKLSSRQGRLNQDVCSTMLEVFGHRDDGPRRWNDRHAARSRR